MSTGARPGRRFTVGRSEDATHPDTIRAAISEFIATAIFVFAAEGSVLSLGTYARRDPPARASTSYIRSVSHMNHVRRSSHLCCVVFVCREDVLPRHGEHGERAGDGGAGARAGTGRGGGGGRQRLGRAREPGRHVRRAGRRPDLARPRGLLLGGAAAGRRGRHAPPPPRHGRRPPARVRAGVRGRRLARRAAGGRHDVRPHVRLLRHRGRPEARPRRHHRAARRGVHARRQRAGRRAVRRRRDEPGAGLRPRARRVAVEAPLGVLARTLPRRRARRAGVRVPGHPVRRRCAAAQHAPPAARAGGLLASQVGRVAGAGGVVSLVGPSTSCCRHVLLCMHVSEIMFVVSCGVVNKGGIRVVWSPHSVGDGESDDVHLNLLLVCM